MVAWSLGGRNLSSPVRLLVAHRVLIGTFVGFSLFLSVFGVRQWRAGGATESLGLAVAGLAMAIGFGIYLKRIWNKTAI